MGEIYWLERDQLQLRATSRQLSAARYQLMCDCDSNLRSVMSALPLTQPMPEDLTVHIYPSDCDSVGHVNHAHMLTLLERARWSALESRMTYPEYMKSKLWAVVRKVEASYHAQTFPGDDLTIRTGLLSIGNTSFVVKQEVRNKKGVMVCDASLVYVTVAPDGKPIPVPDAWRTLFSPWDSAT